MRIKEIHMVNFKRFSDLRITDIPETARLVVLLGINGTGKTCVFEALNKWRRGGSFIDYYHVKYEQPQADCELRTTPPEVTVSFHGQEPHGVARKRAMYLRSAYRNEANFKVDSVGAVSTVENEEMGRLSLLVQDDKRVRQNYNRIVANTVYELFNKQDDDETVTKKQLRETYIGPLRESMQRVFEDLLLQGVGNPHSGGTFLFEKGTSTGFPYINLSAGEKDAFDVLLDIYSRKDVFTDSVYCIDEPDLHMHSQLQARLLKELVKLIPTGSQLWIATHSIGMIRKAIEIQRSDPESVVFLDFSDKDYDTRVDMSPVQVNRLFWKRFLSMALDDMANLVAPGRIVLCEGRPLGTEGRQSRQEHDAKCLRKIFAKEFPDTEFISGGNSDNVAEDSLKLIAAFHKLLTAVKCVRIIDRDGRTDDQVEELKQQGINVLRRRHLESYLLDDEVLEELCKQRGKEDKLDDVKNALEASKASAQSRGKDRDDAKAAAGEFFNAVKSILEIQNPGSNWEAFFSSFMADALQPGLAVYDELKRDIFGSPNS